MFSSSDDIRVQVNTHEVALAELASIPSSRPRMSKDEVLTIKDVVHKLQLYLLEGIKHENQLLAAGSLISLDDYKDVVTERTIAGMCGYPLCTNLLPSDQPRKGRYRISLKEHKVYDLQETYMYCSSNCLINSRAFASSLQDERSSTLNTARLNKLLKQFEGSSLESVVDMGKNGDLGLADLKIQEKTEREAGEVSWEEWIGPSNAIDGYVPLKDKNLEAHQLKNNKKSGRQEKFGSNRRLADPNALDILSNDMNFTSTIIFQDEYNVSKTVPLVEAKKPEGKSSCKDVNCERKPAASLANTRKIRSKESDKYKKATGTDNKVNVPEFIASPSQFHDTSAVKELHEGKKREAGAVGLKSSLKTLDSKKAVRYVSWADKKTDCDGENLQECGKVKNDKGTPVTPHSAVEEVGEGSYRFASAEACATALSQAAEAVASGRYDESDAVSEAGVIILPSLHGVDAAKPEENADVVETDALQLKWPPKPGFSSSELFDSEDSWYDSPPECFNLTLSPFSTMFMALFAWISSSSLAYIYGKEESFCEEYSLVNGREYPHKIVLSDGRSSEIKQTLSGCLARTLPTLVTELRLPIPVSILEQGMGRLLDTMSFTDPIPAFRMKQWQVVVLLFLDALSISRIPSLTQYMLDKRILLHKVMEGAQISSEEFEILKDLMIPLGRAPHFSTQSGA